MSCRIATSTSREIRGEKSFTSDSLNWRKPARLRAKPRTNLIKRRSKISKSNTRQNANEPTKAPRKVLNRGSHHAPGCPSFCPMLADPFACRLDWLVSPNGRRREATIRGSKSGTRTGTSLAQPNQARMVSITHGSSVTLRRLSKIRRGVQSLSLIHI